MENFAELSIFAGSREHLNYRHMLLGHIGYLVVPWKRGNGYASQALRLILPDARKQGLTYVELTVDSDNIASQKTILACGGTLVEHFMKSKAYGQSDSKETLRYRIDLGVLDQKAGQLDNISGTAR